MEKKSLDSTRSEKWDTMKLPYQLIKRITNDFEKERILGSGAFGTVYKGIFKNGKEIAVKVLHNKISGFDGEGFQKEFQNLRELKHQNVVELVGFCDESEEVLVEHEGKQVVALEMHTALCFEYVHNGSLRDHISDECTGLDWPTRYKIIKGICEGLKYLREGLDFSVWHLDLKPDNILLNNKMIPKIEDFGLSRLLCEGKTRKTINTFGTCGYWPPEYINHRVISEFFDIFSLGVILVKIMIGPEGYTRIADMTTRKFVKHVHECWRKLLGEIAGPMLLEVYCNQVKRCIEVALECLKPNRQERPTIQYIVSSLNQTESMIGHQVLLIDQIDSRRKSILNSTWSITSRTYSENCEAVRHNYKDNMFKDPIDVRFNVLENITDGFSNERLIGSGQYGEVYKGVHKDGQVIAVKLLHPTPAFDDRIFQNAFRYDAMAQHRNIIKFVGYCEVDQRRYIEHKGELVYARMEEKVLCFDYMVNGSLEQNILDECSGLDWQLCYGVIKGTCEGLRYLHEKLHKSIIHMDLKSKRQLLGENIIQNFGGFALSRFDVEGTLLTRHLLESLGYMPPEFIALQVISKQHDIYSSGVIIMEMIIGTRRYPENDEMSAKKFIEHKMYEEATRNIEWHGSGKILPTTEKMRRNGVCVDKSKQRPAIGDCVDMQNETENVEMLDVHPPELFFPLDPKRATSCSLHLKNKGDDHIAFMLVAKSPRSYLAKLPLCGVVPPRCTYTIVLTARKQSRSKPPSESVEFIALQSLAVGDHDLQRVGQGSDTAFYDDLFKEAKETAGDEVHEVALKAVRDPPPAEGTTCEPTQSMTIEIIVTQNSQQVTSIDVHPMEPWIMTTHHGGSLRFWSHQNMAILNFFEVTEEPVHVAKFIAREKWVVVGDGNGYILVYSYDQHQEVTSFDAHRTSITCLTVHPTRPFVLSSSHDDHLIKLWDWEKDWECTRTFQGHGVVQITFNLGNTESFACATSDGTVKIWSVHSDDGKIDTLDGLCVDYFMRRNRQHLISGTKDGTAALIWNLDMEAGCVHKLEGHTDSITIVHLHPELPLLITGSLDGTVRLWNSTTYKIENIIDFNLGAVYAFGYIKGLRRMVVGCQHGIAIVDIPVLNIMGSEDTSIEYHEQSEYGAGGV